MLIPVRLPFTNQSGLKSNHFAGWRFNHPSVEVWFALVRIREQTLQVMLDDPNSNWNTALFP